MLGVYNKFSENYKEPLLIIPIEVEFNMDSTGKVNANYSFDGKLNSTKLEITKRIIAQVQLHIQGTIDYANKQHDSKKQIRTLLGMYYESSCTFIVPEDFINTQTVISIECTPIHPKTYDYMYDIPNYEKEDTKPIDNEKSFTLSDAIKQLEQIMDCNGDDVIYAIFLEKSRIRIVLSDSLWYTWSEDNGYQIEIVENK